MTGRRRSRSPASPRTPHQRIGESSDIADAIAALCSGDGAWINGQTVFTNGGIV
ncbi:SDR family oxidoreductase [Mesorhizobium mediterraneum]|uniref:SDR family oxidoreductase n=1 Tax=Mesorhizobium mediterraneum TaxID=43617 RepID=UPI001FEEB7DD|nr:SDR family oxidoreductase [Mesorhizobium mediterraneum]